MPAKLRSLSAVQFLLAVLILTGCQDHWRNMPEAKYATSDEALIGRYTIRDEDGTGSNVTISWSGDRELPLRIHSEEIASDTVAEALAQTFKIGDQQLIFCRHTMKDSQGKRVFGVARYRLSERQLVAEVLNASFFKKNREVLPRVEWGSKYEPFAIDWSSEKVTAFFKKHGNSEELFLVDEPAVYTRVAK